MKGEGGKVGTASHRLAGCTYKGWRAAKSWRGRIKEACGDAGRSEGHEGAVKGR